MKAAWNRIKRLEAIVGTGSKDDAEKALEALWAQFSDSELKSYINYNFNIIDGRSLSVDQIAAHKKFEQLNGPEVVRRSMRYADEAKRLFVEEIEKHPEDLDSLIERYQSGEWQESMRQRGLICTTRQAH